MSASGIEVESETEERTLVVRHRTTGAVICEVRSDAYGVFDLAGRDLTEADLCGADLICTNLQYAHLFRADLAGVDLSGADLSGAVLEDADLTGSCLESATLREACLLGADLSGASLLDADLSNANLESADLTGSRLNCATLREACLLGADLAGASFLDADFSDAELDDDGLICARARRGGARGLPPIGFYAIEGDVGDAASDDGLDDLVAAGDLDALECRELTPEVAEGMEARRRAEWYRSRRPEVPVVEELDARILGILDAGDGALRMDAWHEEAQDACGTTHCRGGWAIALAGEAGRALEARRGAHVAAILIYRASTGRVPDFFASDESALADLRRCARIDALADQTRARWAERRARVAQGARGACSRGEDPS